MATLAVYNPVNGHGFVNYDDDRYVTENAHVRAGFSWNTIGWALTSTEQANWHPLTWLSHALDYQLFHLNAAGHHFTSLLIHALNAALLFLLLVWATGRVGSSLLVAGLFALHPINVESVAWISERKNVLSTFFFLAAIGAYGWYALKPNWKRYAAVAALFALGLMAKPMVITLPFVLILLDYWPLGRIQGSPEFAMPVPQKAMSGLLIEKVPLLLLSPASALITMRAQQAGGSIRSMLQISPGVRIENALVAYILYLWKMVWPTRLAPLYPHPGDSLAASQIALSLAVLMSISAIVLKFRSKRYLLVGWLWFLGTLIPVIGLVQVGDAAMADRYAYIPLIGAFVMIAWGLADLADALKLSLASRMIPVACVLLVLGFATRRQLNYWANSYDLWSHTLAVTAPNFIAQDNLGGALLLMGEPDQAYAHFQAAAEINAHDPMSHSNIGAYLQQHGHLEEAVAQYKIAVGLTSDPGLLATTYANLGSAYRDLGEDRQALQSYDEALRLNANQFNAFLGLGVLEEKQGKLDDAILNYSRAVEIAPSAPGYVRLGHALQRAGRRQDAVAAYRAALAISPDLKEAQDEVNVLSGAQP
jgi:tetratricopeptide (TPR) repeat protein